MPRQARKAPGGLVYHVLNRGVARLPLFQKDGDFLAFEEVMRQALERHPLRLLSFCLMSNHWHMLLWPRADGDLTRFVRWLTHTHTMRWHAHYHTSGSGHLYQGRFKSFPVESNDYFLTVARYVERNALRARLVRRAENWRWSSLWHRVNPGQPLGALLADWPVKAPRDWPTFVNTAQTRAELDALRQAVRRGHPYGSKRWQQAMAKRLGLAHTLRPQGRRRKQGADLPSPELF
jgi:putative transposase